jgi:hypothetical protein
MKTLISCTLSEEANEIYQEWDRGTKSAKISKLIQFDEQYPNIVKALKLREGYLLGLLSSIRNNLAQEMRLNPHLREHSRSKYADIIHQIQTESLGTIYHDPGLSSLELQDN